MSRRTLSAWLLVAGLVLVAAACEPEAEGPTYSPALTPPSAEPIARPTSSSQVDPHFFGGQDIFITDSGTKPHTLNASTGIDVIFHNETDETIVVRSTSIELFTSDPIPPGGSWAYLSDRPIALLYRASPLGGPGKIQWNVNAYVAGPAGTTGP